MFYFFSFKFNQASQGFIYSRGPQGTTTFYLNLGVWNKQYYHLFCLFLHSLWLFSVLKPSWHHLWIFGWWACGQARLWWEASWLCSNLGSRPHCSRTSIWFLTSLGLGFLIYWFLSSSSHSSESFWFVLLVYGFITIWTYSLCQISALTPSKLLSLKLGLSALHMATLLFFPLHPPCISFCSLYIQFFLCLRCISYKQHCGFFTLNYNDILFCIVTVFDTSKKDIPLINYKSGYTCQSYNRHNV